MVARAGRYVDGRHVDDPRARVNADADPTPDAGSDPGSVRGRYEVVRSWCEAEREHAAVDAGRCIDLAARLSAEIASGSHGPAVATAASLAAWARNVAIRLEVANARLAGARRVARPDR